MWRKWCRSTDFFFFSSRRRHTRCSRDWSSDVCSSDLERKCAPGTFRGKLVLVGATATGIGDLRATPFGGANFPGVEIHANVVDNILNDRFLRRDRKSTRLNSSHGYISYAVFCLKKKK